MIKFFADLSVFVKIGNELTKSHSRKGNVVNKIRLIIDSGADMGLEFEKIKGDHLVPLKVIFGEDEYLDSVTLSTKRFYEMLIESESLPTTSQATIVDFEQIYKRIKEAGDQAIVITMSSKLSGTYQSACIAAEEYSDCIRVIDSKQATVGETILVRYARVLRDEGLGLNEIADCLEEKREKICLLALLDTLEYLKKGGRISKTAAIAGGLLSIKPVIAVEDGEIAVLGKARGSKNGNNMLIEFIEKKGGIDFSMPYHLGYTGLEDSKLQKYIADSIEIWQGKAETLPILNVGCAIGTHVGPGAIAIAFFHS